MTPTIQWIRDGVGFAPDAAASFRRAEASWGRRIDTNSTYRDYDRQMSMYLAWNRYVASGYNPALKPPHSRAIHPDLSKHCLGLALDSDDWATPGFIAHMADHGWIRTAASDPTERHHFEYQSKRDNHRNEPAVTNSKPLTPTAPSENRDITMRTLYNTENKNEETRRAAVGELTFQVQGAYASARERQLWGDPVGVDQEEWTGILATVNARRRQAGLPPLKGVRGE